MTAIPLAIEEIKTRNQDDDLVSAFSRINGTTSEITSEITSGCHKEDARRHFCIN